MIGATWMNLGTLAAAAVLGAMASVSGRAAESDTRITRTRAEVEALIKEVGGTSPEWWNSVEPSYPPTLDLSWPLKPAGQWDARRNVGQYLWDVINPNPGRWKEGVKLVHQLMIRHKDDPAKLTRAMNTLGRMFHDLLEDWARAAFWWQMSARRGGEYNPLGLARCYWKLGSKEMALEIVSQYTWDYTRHGAVIKFWAEMGESEKAIKLAEEKARSGMADVAYLAAGDACRLAGDYRRALSYYEKAATARGSNGRIESVKITKHKERQFYSAFTDTPNQIVARQSVKGVDAVTGATMTSEAIINATAKALTGAMRN